MQLYITTYFICKIFIGESVMLRTLHKMLQTLHSVNSKNQNCWNKVIVGIKVIVDTKSEQNLILKQRKNLEAEGFVQTCQQQIVLGQRPSTCDSKVKHSKHSEKKLHIMPWLALWGDSISDNFYGSFKIPLISQWDM